MPAQNKTEFRMLLEQALAIDPDKDKSVRLANLIAQRRARALLDRIDELFGAGAPGHAGAPARRFGTLATLNVPTGVPE
jgi:hypothetical protein